MLSVIIPVLGDTEPLLALLPAVLESARVEVIVVDGADGVAGVVPSHPALTITRAAAGRGAQMNAGAALARGEWLLFLHADSTLPAGWDAAIQSTAADGGWFRFALDDRAWQARVIERLVAWRVRLLRLPYGDQGIFVRRERFQQLGGYADIPLMEDVEFVRRLVTTSRVRPLRLPLVTSARRWRRDGWWGRSIRNLVLVLLYFAGVSPRRLAGWYSSSTRAADGAT